MAALLVSACINFLLAVACYRRAMLRYSQGRHESGMTWTAFWLLFTLLGLFSCGWYVWRLAF